METDPLAVLVRSLTPEEREYQRLYKIQVRNSSKKMKDRIPSTLALLWCEWNRGAADASDLAYAFGQHFSRECLKEWNKLTPEQIERGVLMRQHARRIRYNAYMREYLPKYRKRKETPPSEKHP